MSIACLLISEFPSDSPLASWWWTPGSARSLSSSMSSINSGAILWLWSWWLVSSISLIKTFLFLQMKEPFLLNIFWAFKDRLEDCLLLSLFVDELLLKLVSKFSWYWICCLWSWITYSRSTYGAFLGPNWCLPEFFVWCGWFFLRLCDLADNCALMAGCIISGRVWANLGVDLVLLMDRPLSGLF